MTNASLFGTLLVLFRQSLWNSNYNTVRAFYQIFHADIARHLSAIMVTTMHRTATALTSKDLRQA